MSHMRCLAAGACIKTVWKFTWQTGIYEKKLEWSSINCKNCFKNVKKLKETCKKLLWLVRKSKKSKKGDWKLKRAELGQAYQAAV